MNEGMSYWPDVNIDFNNILTVQKGHIFKIIIIEPISMLISDCWKFSICTVELDLQFYEHFL